MKTYKLELNEKEMKSWVGLLYWSVKYGTKGFKGKQIEADKKLLKKIEKIYPLDKLKKEYKMLDN